MSESFWLNLVDAAEKIETMHTGRAGARAFLRNAWNLASTCLEFIEKPYSTTGSTQAAQIRQFKINFV